MQHQTWWQLSINNICQYFNTDAKQGLNHFEAEQRLKKYGLNQLPEQKKISVLFLFLNQFSNFIVWILIGALFISGFLGEWIDALAIGIIIILNALIGFFQEYRAERSLEALKKLTKPTSKVIRNGILQTIASHLLVPGDLVVLEAGDFVPADGRIIYAAQLATQEASLTGESTPVEKNTHPLSPEKLTLADQKNMAFCGTNVTRGKGSIIITQTGLKTELGKIASSLTQEEEPTPLQQQLKTVGHQLILFCLSIIVIVFVLGIWRGYETFSMILTALSLAVAAIPEGLPAVVTIALALGVNKMAKKNAIVRRLMSVETLGCTSVICTDKTGTLTKNEMTVQKIWANEAEFEVTGVGYEPRGQFLHNQTIIKHNDYPELMLALKISVLCNSANLTQTNQQWQITGDPTEGALLVAAAKAGLEKQSLETQYPLLNEIPFDSERKRMSIIRNTPQGPTLFIKGAPDVLGDLSSHILLNNQKIIVTEQHKKNIMHANEMLAQQALRVLAVAYRELSDQEHVNESLEKNLIFVGLLAMIDPPRPEVKKALETCKQAGIKTVMITGDHKETAVAIGKELGLIESNNAITGIELDTMSDEELKNSVQDINIYARTTAEHKIRIVKAFKTQGHIVAVTGDGVNDAPAIKAADIGVAMGITGTEVTKEASDMVITDDNFASIVNAIEEGRGIYDNIVKFVNYLISANIAELLIIFIGIIFAFKDPTGKPYISLLPIQLLWLNLITDGLPALAFAMDPLDPHAMKRPPRKLQEKILSHSFALNLFIISLIITLGVFVACHFGLRTSAELGHTMTLTTLVLLELVRVHMIRSRYNISFLSNQWMIFALVSSFFLQLFIVYIPSLQKIFRMVPLGFYEWSVIIIIALTTWFFSTAAELFLDKFSLRK